MKSKILIIAWLFFIPLVTFATPMNKLTPDDRTFNNDTTTFKGHIENAEFQVWLDIDFYKQNIIVPRQEVFGEVAGYLGAKRDTRKWIISDVEIRGEVATLTIINDYGSESGKTSKSGFIPPPSRTIRPLAVVNSLVKESGTCSTYPPLLCL